MKPIHEEQARVIRTLDLFIYVIVALILIYGVFYFGWLLMSHYECRKSGYSASYVELNFVTYCTDEEKFPYDEVIGD